MKLFQRFVCMQFKFVNLFKCTEIHGKCTEKILFWDKGCITILMKFMRDYSPLFDGNLLT